MQKSKIPSLYKAPSIAFGVVTIVVYILYRILVRWQTSQAGINSEQAYAMYSQMGLGSYIWIIAIGYGVAAAVVAFVVVVIIRAIKSK